MNNQGVIKRIFREVIPEDSSRGNTVRKLFSSLTEPWFLSLIRKSDLFDRDWYLSTYPEIARDKLDPYRHYLRSGWREGCDPGPKFSNEWYLSTYDDVRKPGLNPLVDYLLFGKRAGRKISSEIVDEIEDDRSFIEKTYPRYFHRPINFSEPKTYTEKIQVYKLYYRTPLLNQVLDKLLVRNYIANKCGEGFLIPLLGVFDQVDDVPWQQLPQQFVLKANHGSAWNIICTDKTKLNWLVEGKKVRKWMRTNYYYILREWGYKDIKPKILVEKLLLTKNNHSFNELGFYCFNGIPKYSLFRFKVDGVTNRRYFDTEWNPMYDWTKPFDKDAQPKRPPCLDKMLELSKQLSAEFPLARIDFYYAEDQLYTGEITIYPGAGFEFKLQPPKWDEIIGSWFDISGFYPPH